MICRVGADWRPRPSSTLADDDKYVALLKEWNAAVADFNAMYGKRRPANRHASADTA
jgi:hypothetical protein